MNIELELVKMEVERIISGQLKECLIKTIDEFVEKINSENDSFQLLDIKIDKVNYIIGVKNETIK